MMNDEGERMMIQCHTRSDDKGWKKGSDKNREEKRRDLMAGNLPKLEGSHLSNGLLSRVV
jgi:hypothetical protein